MMTMVVVVETGGSQYACVQCLWAIQSQDSGSCNLLPETSPTFTRLSIAASMGPFECCDCRSLFLLSVASCVQKDCVSFKNHHHHTHTHTEASLDNVCRVFLARPSTNTFATHTSRPQGFYRRTSVRKRPHTHDDDDDSNTIYISRSLASLFSPMFRHFLLLRLSAHTRTIAKVSGQKIPLKEIVLRWRWREEARFDSLKSFHLNSSLILYLIERSPSYCHAVCVCVCLFRIQIKLITWLKHQWKASPPRFCLV